MATASRPSQPRHNMDARDTAKGFTVLRLAVLWLIQSQASLLVPVTETGPFDTIDHTIADHTIIDDISSSVTEDSLFM